MPVNYKDVRVGDLLVYVRDGKEELWEVTHKIGEEYDFDIRVAPYDVVFKQSSSEHLTCTENFVRIDKRFHKVKNWRKVVNG